MHKRSIEVCFTPKTFSDIITKENFVVVIVDVLRATSAMCAAFQNGVKQIIPVAKPEDARKYKERGFLVAAERDGQKLDFADFGNSPFNFVTESVKGKVIVYSTTNGTQAIEMAKSSDGVVIGSFLNLSALVKWLVAQEKNVVVLCAGWKNKFNLEDSVFAGALTEALLVSGKFNTQCDSAQAAMDLWDLAKVDLMKYIEKASHKHRLKKMHLDDSIGLCLTTDVTNAVPVLKGEFIENINYKS